MSQYPYTGPYSTQNPQTTGTGMGTGSSITNTGTGLGTGTTGYGTAGTGYGTSGTGYGTTGTTVGQQPIIKRKHRPESRSSSSSSSDKEKETGQKKSFGQKLKEIPAKIKEMMPGHHDAPQQQQGSNYPS